METIISFRSIAVILLSLSLAASCLADPVNVEVTNVDIDNFPGVHIFVRVTDETGAYIEDLGSNNFEVRENGTLCTVDVEAEFGYMAVSLVMDESGSMGTNPLWPTQVIDACTYFVNGMETLDKGAIIKFSTSSYVDVDMTFDKDDLLESIASYQTNGLTDLYDAIGLGINECFFEPEKKAVLVFTDGNDNQPGYFAAQLPGLAGTDITIYAIGIGNITPDSLIYIANQTGGFYLQITDPSQMQQVLEDIRNDIGNLYNVYYVTPQPALNGTPRAIEVVCNYQGDSGWDTTSYVAPFTSPPYIQLSTATFQLLGTQRPAGVGVQVSCTIRSSNTITSARIYYKTTGGQYFNQAEMSHTGDNYYYTIPAATVQNPGVEFYFQATDNLGSTVTYPKYSPSYLPLSFAVAPNFAPVITYDAPEIWLHRRTLPVEVQITDNNSVAEATLFYRVPGTFFYVQTPLASIGNNTFIASLAGPLLNQQDDLEIFIAAWDPTQVVNYWYLSELPFLLNIAAELPPTPPAVALEPASVPIIVPANGGEFDYVANVINPIPFEGECDVWAEMLTPGGSYQEIGLLLDDLELLGGETYPDSITQEVPDTAAAGNYQYIVHTGDYTTGEIFYTAEFAFMKLPALLGPITYHSGWIFYSQESQLTDIPQPVMIAADQPFIGGACPNPFNMETSLEFYLPQSGNASLKIYNIKGEEIAVLTDGFRQPGIHRITWNAAGCSTGIYFCAFSTSQGTQLTKLVLVK